MQSKPSLTKRETLETTTIVIMQSSDSDNSASGLNKNRDYVEFSTVNVTDDREAYPKFWIAAYTRPKSEKKAATEIEALHIETYVPTQKAVRQWSDRKKKVDVVLIPMVMFARVTAEDIITIKKHPLIIKVLTFPGQKEAARIPDQQISDLKFMLHEADTPVTFIPQPFNLTDTVRVTRGKLSGLTGKVERITEGKTKLIVSIDLLGGAMVEIDTSDLETFSQSN